MQITVYGASGKVGQRLVAELLTAGHSVVAFVHHQNPFSEQAMVKVVSGSVDDFLAVAKAAASSQVLISTLGSWGTPAKTVVSTGTAAMIAAAAEHRITRVITLTGASAFGAHDRPTVLDQLSHSLLRLIAPKILRDGEVHLRLLEASSLEWTCLRSPAMLGFGRSNYRLVNRLPSVIATIPRQAVVQALVDQVSDSTRYQQAPVVSRV